MKRVMIAVAALALGLGSLATDAEAKRLGGGKSSGISRDTGAMKQAGPSGMAGTPAKPAQAAPAPAAAPQPAPAAAKSGMSRWLGPIAGLAAGIGLAALLSHFGMGEAVANFLMIALLAIAVVFVLRLIFRKKQQPADGLQYAGAGANAPASFERQEPAGARFDAPADVGAGGTANSSAASYGIPAGFDVEGFVRQAKLNFVRLQAANDRGDMEDIRQFTSPELFAEIQMQYQERGKAAQQTDVVVLNAELLDVTSEPGRHVASVRFHGQLREEAHAAPDAFDEIWHLVKPSDGSRGWLVAGIQQD